jgi:flavodoxin I
MSKIAVIYWSGTGNTEAMADLVANAAAAAGASVDKFTASEFNVSSAGDYTGFALGCPAMGAEQLEESEFEPMFAGLEGSLNGKKVALFGSYGWGDGQWMRDWCERAKEDGAQLFSDEGLICNETPDDDVQAACRKLGADLANW